MKTLLLISMVIIIWSCGTQPKNEQVEVPQNDFQILVSNLNSLESGYTYNYIEQETEGCYIPKGNDSLFYNPPFPILGVFSQNSEVYCVIHFEPGDDMWPILRTFDSKGVEIDKEGIGVGICAAGGCELGECNEFFRIIDNRTIEDILTYVITDCDSLGNKIVGTTKTVTKREVISIDSNGHIEVKKESSEPIEEAENNFEDPFKLENYLVDKVIASGELQEISESVALLIYPTDSQIEEMKKEYGEEDFYTVADDAQWYQAQAIQILDSLGVKMIGDKSRFIRFKGQGEKSIWTLDIRKENAPEWNIIFFHKNKTPEIISAIDLTHDHIKEYFNL